MAALSLYRLHNYGLGWRACVRNLVDTTIACDRIRSAAPGLKSILLVSFADDSCCCILETLEGLAGLVADLPPLDDTGFDHVVDEVDGFPAAGQLLILDDLRDGGMSPDTGQLHGELSVSGNDNFPVDGQPVPVQLTCSRGNA